MTSSGIEISSLIETIWSFQLPADFLKWLSNGNFDQQIILEEKRADIFRRIVRFAIHDSLICTLMGDHHFNAMKPELIHAMATQSPPSYSSHPLFSKAIRKPSAVHLSEDHYSVITEIIYDGTKMGATWEVYEIQNILPFYKMKNDPLSYWKSSQRE